MPTRPYGYVKLNIGGDAPGGEQWSIGLSIAAQNSPSGSDLDAWLTGLAPGISHWMNGGTHVIASVVASDTFLSRLTAYKYDSGAATASAQGHFEYSPAMNGAAAHVLPLSSAMCVTLRTDHAGRSYRGRVYLPANGAVLTNHLYATADVDAVAVATTDLLDNINGSTLAGGGVAVIVAGAANPPGIVTGFSIDNRPDTQRRRAKSEKATYRNTVTL
jgi:hypothetical protein